jgi:CRP/FNR family transcriptional regulator, cyclic AMP receptor protein
MGTQVTMFRNAREVERYSAGQVIFSAGQRGDTMYVVVEGRVDIIQGDRLVATLGPDELFGEMALIDKGPRSATAVARTPTIVAPVTERHFLFLAQHNPYFALDVMRILAGRLRGGSQSNAADSLAFLLA